MTILKKCKNCGADFEKCYELIPVVMVAGEIGILCPICKYIHKIESEIKKEAKK